MSISAGISTNTGGGIGGCAIGLVLILVLFVGAVVAFDSVNAIAMPEIKGQINPQHVEHAEAATIRQCSQDPNNILEVWVNGSGERLNCLINTPEFIGNRVIQFCKRGWFEVTAYVISNGSLEEAQNIMKAKGCTKLFP